MDTRQEIIQKAYELLVMMERVTGYEPWEAFYRSVVEALETVPENELPEMFVRIADIVTQSVDRAAEQISELKKLALFEEEREDRTREVKEVSELLNF